jgi:GT2 family glycosyltransferase
MENDMNPVLLLTHNCLSMTKRCVESIRAQDIPTEIGIIDNGSTDGTPDWIDGEKVQAVLFGGNAGVSKGWNTGLRLAFAEPDHTHVLVLNNDTVLPPYFLRVLLGYDLPFITGSSVASMEDMENQGPFSQAYPGPDFSAFLIRRDCWEKVGPFDEAMKHYCGDCDYHVRAHRMGISLMNAGVRFYHERSSTLRLSSPEERRSIERQADADRETFQRKYGCFPWEEAYADLFKTEKVR